MKKKILSLGLITLLLVLSVSPQFADEKEVINLNDLIQKSKDSHIDYTLLKKQKERKKRDYITSSRIATALKYNEPDEDDVVTHEDKVAMDLRPLQTKKAYLDKKFEFIKKENEIKREAISHYFQFFILKKDMKNKADHYSFMEEKKAANDTSFSLGQITKLDVDTFSQSYQQAYIHYLEAANGFNNKKRELNIFVDQDPEEILQVAEAPIPKANLENVDIEKTLERMLKSSYRIKGLEIELDMTKQEQRLKERFKGYGEKAIEIDLLNDKIEELKAQLEDEKRNVKYDLYSQFHSAKLALKNFEVKKLEEDIAKKNYDIAKAKFESGLLSPLDLTESRNKFETAYYGALDAQLAHYLKIKAFQDFVKENTVDIEKES